MWRKSQALNHAAAPVAALTLQSLDESLRPEEKGKSRARKGIFEVGLEAKATRLGNRWRA